MEEEKIYQIALCMVPGIGSVLSRLLISYFGSAEKVLKAPAAKLMKVPGIGEKCALSIKTHKKLKEASEMYYKCSNAGVEIRLFSDNNYPSRLRQLPDCPSMVYVKGNANFENPKSIAIVGSRQASAYGLEQTQFLLEALRKYNPLIVSGLAYGVDIQAHRHSLLLGLQTVGILASGFQYIYPADHKKTAEKMMQQGGLLSEYMFDESPEAKNFPARNRIIAGLADLTIVVEAAERSGALITAEYANSYNREVMAIPGNLNKRTSLGCNLLIKNHKAHIYTRPQDLVELLSWDNELVQERPQPQLNLDLSEKEASVMNALSGESKIHLDTLAWKTQIPIYELVALLLEMELKNLVRQHPGNLFGIAARK